MRVARSAADLRIERARSVALVPTMGAFHEGHLSLMRRARDLAEIVVVSLFVNPTQFGPGEDFEKYPRNEERDFEMAAGEGVDWLFAPSVVEMYPSQDTKVCVGRIGDRWEGEHRPCHFDGVATVVAKLLNIVNPDWAVFGLKDFQQCAVVARMVADLNFRVKLDLADTVREPDGLAMSSRNAYLSVEQRKIAPLINQVLTQLSVDLASSAPQPGFIEAQLAGARQTLSGAGFVIDYVDAVDPGTLEPKREMRGSLQLIAAASLGATRLIDNAKVDFLNSYRLRAS